ncbi:hypothetical protein [Chryseobacterium indoltheticum]|uniref:Uncharacterized protein n=1 Tax=Chryseobacterium indoltheticum TaxID=254 RepID=A0A381FHC4_9FLAO|nr:hypothetical protein [Chryseobacterium indoltheticum]AZA74753.1 hypothetical protein EG358_13700 [Chryseobacterium indoltheticum]SIQ36522.1 hypothetical protein SAMN05421682_104230 [Chryseobacterium indoltheticum]SUX45959.1 Uncharacterised protein [Chryseobacterium indoltheticum]
MKLQTKFEEEVLITSDVELMKGMYTRKRVLRGWSEDFIDEDTGEVVSIERHEIVMDRGILIDNSNISILQFHLAAGDLESVELSNQKRDGIFYSSMGSIWSVTASINGKNKNIYLYANSPDMALAIAKDFIEQQYPGGFGISSLKEMAMMHLLTKLSQETDGELKFYKIEVEIENEAGSYNRIYIVRATDAENAKALIDAYVISENNKLETPVEELHLTLLSASTVPCEAMIDFDFCNKYFEADKEK